MIELGLNTRIEKRQSSGTDAIVSALLSSVRGTGSTLTANTASALEIAAGWWGRCLGAAIVEPAMPAVDGWRYRLELAGPTSTETVMRSRASVVHFKLNGDPRQPWRGLSPLGWATTTARLNGSLEKTLADESGGPVGNLIPMIEGSAANDDFRDALNSLAGDVGLPQTTSGGGDDPGQRPARDFDPKRLGPHPPESLVRLRLQVEMCVYALFGVSPSLVSSFIRWHRNARKFSQASNVGNPTACKHHRERAPTRFRSSGLAFARTAEGAGHSRLGASASQSGASRNGL